MKKLALIPALLAVFLLSAAEKQEISGKLVGIFPENIKCIAVLSPASKPNEKQIRQGIAMLEKAGIKVKLMPHAFEGSSKKSAPLENRLADWNMAVGDPEVDMIIPTRGGTGSQDLVKLIDWKKFKERDLILMGFSNITCITGAMDHHKAGYPIAGPNLGRLVTADKKTLLHLKAVLAKRDIPPVKLTPVKKGNARGRIYAGHLGLLENNRVSSFPADTAGRVIFIECVGRPTAKLDATFNSLLQKGFFDNAAAVVLCHFTKVADNEKLPELFMNWAAKLKCPVYKGYPYGHRNDNYALDFARTAVIRDDVLYFE
jgi:muramoyltetrapeptide carboxypeptidase